MKRNLLPALLILTSVILFSSCTKDDPTTVPPYTVPATYDYVNVEYAEATAKINMWSGFTAYLSKATTRQLSQDTVTYLWNNTNSAFTPEILVNLQNTHTDLNSSSLNLSANSADPTLFKALADSMVVVSAANTTAGSEGVAGK